jgi:hypothetical protein
MTPWQKLLSIAVVFLLFSSQANSKLTPEQESLFIVKHLKPIPDDQWNTIAKTKLTEKYTISKGDTLSDISQRLFGDPKYWPKVWALNNSSITNPHRILPGVLIAFSPGTGTSLPFIAMNQTDSSVNSATNTAPTAATDAPVNPLEGMKSRSQEWRNMPHQTWEEFKVDLPASVDPLGFDRDSKISFAFKSKGYEPVSIPSTEKLTYLGQIVGSRSEGEYLGLNDTVYIRPDTRIQVGDTYTITQEPNILKSDKSDRIAYAYKNLGRVKILGSRDRLFIGTIVSAHDFIQRGSSLIPAVLPIKDLTPIPGQSSIEGVVLFDHFMSTFTSAQFKEVFIDRGTQDNVKPGMVFRVYEHYDPSNQKKITNSDFIIDADILVTQTTTNYCAGVLINSLSLVYENSTAVLLEDISDLIKNPGFNERGGNPKNKDELDDLDKLDNQEGLGKEEKKELKQLERWHGNPDHPPAPDSSTNASPPPPPQLPASEEATNPPPPPPPETPSNPGEAASTPATTPEDNSIAAPPPIETGTTPPPPADAIPSLPTPGNAATGSEPNLPAPPSGTAPAGSAPTGGTNEPDIPPPPAN